MADFALGAIPDPPDERDYPASLYLPRVTVPAELDLRPAMGAVRNQRSLGSCVAFGSCAVKEYHDRPDGGGGDDLAEQWLYGRCKALDGYAGEGTYPRVAMDVLRKEGVPEESYQPYEGRYPPLHPPLAGATENAAQYRISAYASVRLDRESMKAAMAAAGPLGVTVEVWSNFYDLPSTGRVPLPAGDREGYHMMAACGYTEDGLWVKNSWGATWGAKGYCFYPWVVWDAVSTGAWSVTDIPAVLKHWPDWPDNALLEQDKLWQSGAMLGYQDGTFRPWQNTLRRHVALILYRIGRPYDAGWIEDYAEATRGWVRDAYPGLPWQEERWSEPLTRYQLGLLVARSL